MEILEYYFGSWAERVTESDIIGNNSDYNKAWNYYDFLKYNENLQQQLDGKLEDAFQLVINSNIPLFDQIRRIPGKENVVFGLELNDLIEPENTIEETLKLTNLIYYESFSELGDWELSIEHRTILEEIALLPGYTYGPGVYHAWKMLDTVINSPLEIEEKIGSIGLVKQFTIYPNPSSNLIYIATNLVNYEAIDLTIFDIFGRAVINIQQHNPADPINVSAITSGVYQIEIKASGFIKESQKIVIFKPEN